MNIAGNYKLLRIMICVGVSLGLAIGFAYRYLGSKEEPKVPVANDSFQKLSTSGDVLNPTISPDGKSFVFTRNGKLFLQEINSGNILQIFVTDHEKFSDICFSNNGENIYFRDGNSLETGGDIFEVSRFGGVARKFLENSWSGISFSSDGKKVAFVRYFSKESKWSLLIKDLEANSEKVIFEKNSPDSIYRSGFPSWSPDGNSLVTVAQEKSTSVIYTINVDTGEAEVQPTPKFVQIEQTIWSADGSSMFMVARENDRYFQLWKMKYPSREIQRITNDLNIYRHISLSADNKTLIAQQQSIYSHLWISNTDDLENPKQLTSGNLNRDGNAGIAWTPEGNLVYASRITGNVDIWALRLSDNSRQQLTKEGGPSNTNPSVSPDGKHIYFESNRSGNRNIWRMGINGESPTQVTFSENESDYFPTVSRDGRSLYFLQKSAKGNAIIQKSLTDNSVIELTTRGKLSPESFLALSADGKLLAFHNVKDKSVENSDTKSWEIGVVDLSRQNRLSFFEIPHSTGSFSFAADSRSYYFIEDTPGDSRIMQRNVLGNEDAKTILWIENESISNFQWSPDFKKLAFARGKQSSDAILLRNFE